MNESSKPIIRRPGWLKIKLGGGDNYSKVKDLVRSKTLHTVCESAHCPNLAECWGRKTATFMIMGDQCSRNCRFCAVPQGLLMPLDPNEPENISQAILELGLQYAVITSVTRDDLPDGGASHFAETIRAIKASVSGCRIEVLIPDFKGQQKSLDILFNALPDVINHNVETVPSLYSQVRPQANYQRSLSVIAYANDKGFTTKSGMMLGLGETREQVIATMTDLHSVGCHILTLGQYLQPSRNHLPVIKYLLPKEFEYYQSVGLAKGFKHVEAGPLVRSSYHADEQHGSI